MFYFINTSQNYGWNNYITIQEYARLRPYLNPSKKYDYDGADKLSVEDRRAIEEEKIEMIMLMDVPEGKVTAE